MKKIEDIVCDLLSKSIKELIATDKRLLDLKVSERCICARLALHIDNNMREYDKENGSRVFEGYYADVEFNRMYGVLPKKVFYDDIKHSVSCDLLIHSRGEKTLDNYLCLEMKKEENKEKCEEDRKRIMAMTISNPKSNTEYVENTLVGVYMTLTPSSFELEFYKKGEFYEKKMIEIF